jgi:hypothetical protein
MNHFNIVSIHLLQIIYISQFHPSFIKPQSEMRSGYTQVIVLFWLLIVMFLFYWTKQT